MNNLTATQKQHFDIYGKLLIEWNKKFNLTRITDPTEIEVKHFEDSLSYAEAIKFAGFDLTKPLNICDAGTGAGFPGIPLKIVYPHWNVTLIEATAKKCLFLEEVIKQLELKNITILNTRAESLSSVIPDLIRNPRFDIVTARAVAPLEKLVTWCLPLLKKGGALVTQKGQKELPLIEKFKEKNKNLRVKTLNYEEKVFVIVGGLGWGRTTDLFNVNEALYR